MRPLPSATATTPPIARTSFVIAIAAAPELGGNDVLLGRERQRGVGERGAVACGVDAVLVAAAAPGEHDLGPHALRDVVA